MAEHRLGILRGRRAALLWTGALSISLSVHAGVLAVLHLAQRGHSAPPRLPVARGDADPGPTPPGLTHTVQFALAPPEQTPQATGDQDPEPEMVVEAPPVVDRPEAPPGPLVVDQPAIQLAEAQVPAAPMEARPGDPPADAHDLTQLTQAMEIIDRARQELAVQLTNAMRALLDQWRSPPPSAGLQEGDGAPPDEAADPNAPASAATAPMTATAPPAHDAAAAAATRSTVDSSSGSQAQGFEQAPDALGSNRPPEYPPQALRDRRSGTVLLTVSIRDDGSVSQVLVKRTSGCDLLDQAAVKAAGLWRFTPAQSHGRPIPAEVDIPVQFIIRR